MEAVQFGRPRPQNVPIGNWALQRRAIEVAQYGTYPKEGSRDGELANRVWRDALHRATPFWVERNVFPLVQLHADDSPFHESDLPFPVGLVLLEHPITIENAGTAQGWTGRQQIELIAWRVLEGTGGALTYAPMQRFEQDGAVRGVGLELSAMMAGAAPDKLEGNAPRLVLSILRFAMSRKASILQPRMERTGTYKIDMEIAKAEHDPGSGPAIITLRSLANAAIKRGDATQAIDWKIRWNVRGHKRNLHSGAVTWVKPYTKGPKDAPIRQAVYDVSR